MIRASFFIADQEFTVIFTELTLKKPMSHKFYDLTFTPSVKASQEHYGTRKNYARFEGGEPDFHGLTDAELDFIEQRDGFYMATVGETGQPYIQFRGGPQGFLKVLDTMAEIEPMTRSFRDQIEKLEKEIEELKSGCTG